MLNVELKLLKIFVAVVDCGGFTAAERELNLSRSTISIHMADLEHKLGMTLCSRGRAGFRLSQAGQSVYTAALQLLASAEAFATHIDGLSHDVMTGELKLAITDGTFNDTNFRLAQSLKEFEKKAPQVYLKLYSATQVDIERQLSKAEVDIGIIARHRSLPEFNYYPLHHEDNYLYCSADHELFSKQDRYITETVLQQQKFVHADFFLNSLVSSLSQQFNTSASAGHVEARAFLILSGSYIGFLPEHYAHTLELEGKLRKLKAKVKYYQTEIAAVTRKGNQSDPLLSLFLATLKDQYHVHKP